jgi:ribosomal protein L11 methyltransferase
MCLELLRELAESPHAPRGLAAHVGVGALLDWGTGSGVLAIAAARLGFSPVKGIEIDPAAAHAARRNVVRNDVDVDITVGDVTMRTPTALTVVANLTLPLLNGLSRERLPNRLIASGFLAGQRPDLPMTIVETRELDGWAALVLER